MRRGVALAAIIKEPDDDALEEQKQVLNAELSQLVESIESAVVLFGDSQRG